MTFLQVPSACSTHVLIAQVGPERYRPSLQISLTTTNLDAKLLLKVSAHSQIKSKPLKV